MVALNQHSFAICKTILFCLLFLALGSIVAIPGPTMTSLQENLTDKGTLDLLFVFRPLGQIAGAILSGLLLDRVKMKEPVLITEGAAVGLFIIGFGFCDITWKVYLVIFFVGFASHSLDLGSNVCFLNLWGRKAATYYQILHFSFGAGALLAPLIAKPFVEDTVQNRNYPPSIVWAYVIVGCNILFIILLFSLFTIFTWKETVSFKTESATNDSAVAASVAQPLRLYTILSLIFVLIAAFFELSIEISYPQCLSTYAVTDYLQMSKQQASYLTAAFWAPFMISRFAAIFATKYIKLSLIICQCCIFQVIAGFVLVFVGYEHIAGVWVGTALLGWGSGPVFPAMLPWFSMYVEMTFTIGSTFFVAGAFSEMIIPHILLINAGTEPRLLSYWALAASLMASLSYFLLWKVFGHIQNIYKKNTSDQHTPSVHKLSVEDMNLTAMGEGIMEQSFSTLEINQRNNYSKKIKKEQGLQN